MAEVCTLTVLALLSSSSLSIPSLPVKLGVFSLIVCIGAQPFGTKRQEKYKWLLFRLQFEHLMGISCIHI